MGASSGQFSYGSIVEVSTDNVTFSQIAEVAETQFPDKTRKSAKATHLASDDQYTEEKPAMKDSNKPSLTFNLTPAQYTTLDGYFEAGTILYWRFSVPKRQGETTPERWVLQGWISKLGGPRANPDDSNVQQCDCEITRSNAKPTHTAGS